MLAHDAFGAYDGPHGGVIVEVGELDGDDSQGGLGLVGEHADGGFDHPAADLLAGEPVGGDVPGADGACGGGEGGRRAVAARVAHDLSEFAHHVVQALDVSRDGGAVPAVQPKVDGLTASETIGDPEASGCACEQCGGLEEQADGARVVLANARQAGERHQLRIDAPGENGGV